MSWRLALSLLKLRDEFNAKFPNRSKLSDGTIGDPAHKSRESDHNAWVLDGTMGVVTAIDLTEDDAPGFPEIVDWMVKELVRRRDPRVKYIIHEGTIWRSYDKPGIPAWTPAPYTGENAHTKHGHVSVQPVKALYDDDSPWFAEEPVDEVRLTPKERAALKALRALRDAAKEAGNVNRAKKFQEEWIDRFKRDFG